MNERATAFTSVEPTEAKVVRTTPDGSRHVRKHMAPRTLAKTFNNDNLSPVDTISKCPTDNQSRFVNTGFQAFLERTDY